MSSQAWEVIGGGKSGGIVVREGKDVKSKELPERLAKGALVRQEQLAGERLSYTKLQGDGPPAGWVSLKLKGVDLLAAVPSPPPPVTKAAEVAQPTSGEQVLRMQRELWEGFSDPDFQQRFGDFLSRHPDHTGREYIMGQQQLFLTVQGKVAERHGYKKNQRGVNQMIKLLTEHSLDGSSEIARIGAQIGLLLAVAPPLQEEIRPPVQPLADAPEVGPVLARALDAFSQYCCREDLMIDVEKYCGRTLSRDTHTTLAFVQEDQQRTLWEALLALALVPGSSVDAMVDAGLDAGIGGDRLPYWMQGCWLAWQIAAIPSQQEQRPSDGLGFFRPHFLPQRPRLHPGLRGRNAGGSAGTPGGSWPCKMGNAQRTGATERRSVRKLASTKWSFHTFGLAYNSPLIDEAGNVYVTTTVDEVFCLDKEGALRWSYRLFAKGCSSNPAIWGGALFIADSSGVGYAIETATGRARWFRKFASKCGAGNPTVTAGEGLAIFDAAIGGEGWSEENEFVACDAESGEERWRFRKEAPFYNVIHAFTVDNAALVYTDMNGGIHKCEASTGREIWSVPGYPFPLTEEVGWTGGRTAPRCHGALALIQGDWVYSSGNPTPCTGRVRGHCLETGEVRWSTDLAHMTGNAAAFAELDNGVPMLVLGSGNTCLHPMSETRPPFYGKVYGLRATSGEVLWVFEPEPWFLDVCAGSMKLAGVSQVNMPDAFNAPTIDGNGTVFIAWHGGALYALDGRDGRELSQHRMPASQSEAAVGPHGELVVTAGMSTFSFWPEAVEAKDRAPLEL